MYPSTEDTEMTPGVDADQASGSNGEDGPAQGSKKEDDDEIEETTSSSSSSGSSSESDGAQKNEGSATEAGKAATEEDEEANQDAGSGTAALTTAVKLNAGGFPSTSLRTPAPAPVPIPSPRPKRPLRFNRDDDPSDPAVKRARFGDPPPALTSALRPAEPSFARPLQSSPAPPVPTPVPVSQATSVPPPPPPQDTNPAHDSNNDMAVSPPRPSTPLPSSPVPSVHTRDPPRFEFPSLDNLPELDVHFGRLGIDRPHPRPDRRRSISPGPGLTVPQLPRNRAVSQMPPSPSGSSGGFAELLRALKDWECPAFKTKPTAPTDEATGAAQSSARPKVSKDKATPKASSLPPTTVLKDDTPENRDLIQRHMTDYGKGQFSNLTWIKTARLVARMVVRRLHDIPLRQDQMGTIEGGQFPQGGSGIQDNEALEFGKFLITFFLFFSISCL